MPRGSHFLLLRQKQVTKEKATPTIGLTLRCSEKSGTKKTRFAQTVFRSDRFFPPLLGANQRGPVAPMFDRFAMRVVAFPARPERSEGSDGMTWFVYHDPARAAGAVTFFASPK